nr:MAG TPA_asm: hypothetical protein [Caudoviricetes sp.]
MISRCICSQRTFVYAAIFALLTLFIHTVKNNTVYKHSVEGFLCVLRSA